MRMTTRKNSSRPALVQKEGEAAASLSPLPVSSTADGHQLAPAASPAPSSSCSSPSTARLAAIDGSGAASVSPAKRSGSSRQRLRIDVATDCLTFSPQLVAACRAVQKDDAATLCAIVEGSWVEASAADQEEQAAAPPLTAFPAPPLQADGWIPPSVVRDSRGELLLDAHGLDIPEPTTLLHLAARYDAVCCIRLLLEKGVPAGLLDSQRTNALDECATYDMVSAARLLYAHGCDPLHRNNNGANVVHTAASLGCLSVLRWLTRELRLSSADLNRRDSTGYTPLMWALDCERAVRHDCMQLLIAAGADVNCRDVDGNTPLLWACSESCDDVVKLLVRSRADLHAVNKRGRDAFSGFEWDRKGELVGEDGFPLVKQKDSKKAKGKRKGKAKTAQKKGESSQQVNGSELTSLNGSDHPISTADDAAAAQAEVQQQQQQQQNAAMTDGDDDDLLPLSSLLPHSQGGSQSVNGSANSSSPSSSPVTTPSSTAAAYGNCHAFASVSASPSASAPARAQLLPVSSRKRSTLDEREALIPPHLRCESRRARCKRYLFQEMLNRAVEEGDSGNVSRIRELLDGWHADHRRFRLFPLEYDATYPVGPLQIAVAFQNDDTTVLQLLLDAGLDFYKKTATGFLPIHAAANVGNARSVSLLLQRGCDPNLTEEKDGYTALMMAADDLKDGGEVVRVLLETGRVDVNAQDLHGNTAIHWAAFKANVPVLQRLLAYRGRDREQHRTLAVNTAVVNKWGNAPMHYAVYRAWKSEEHLEVLSRLLEAKVSVVLPLNKQQLSPLQLFAGRETEGGQKVCKLLAPYMPPQPSAAAGVPRPPPVNGSAHGNGSGNGSVSTDSEEADASVSSPASPSSRSPSPSPSPSPSLSRKVSKSKKRKLVPAPSTEEALRRYWPAGKKRSADPYCDFVILYSAADLSQGQEPQPIPVINFHDHSAPHFQYIAHREWVRRGGEEGGKEEGGEGLQGALTREMLDGWKAGDVKAQCDCIDGCWDEKRCACVGYFPLEQQKDLGYLDRFLSPSVSASAAAVYGSGPASWSASTGCARSGSSFTAYRSSSSSSFLWRGAAPSYSAPPRARNTRNSMSAALFQASPSALSAATAASASSSANASSSSSSTSSSSSPSHSERVVIELMDEAMTLMTALGGHSKAAAQPVLQSSPDSSQSQPTSQESELDLAGAAASSDTNSSCLSSLSSSTADAVSRKSLSWSATSPLNPRSLLAPPDSRLHEVNYLAECGPLCGCPASCSNRATQRGVSVRLQVFNTLQKGWACRTLQPLRAGQFVSEYVGEMVDETEAERRVSQYDTDGLHYMFGLKGSSFSIDPVQRGNIGRVFNHSCQPNLHKLQVYQHPHRRRLHRDAAAAVGDGSGGGNGNVLPCPRMVFVAARDICRYEELCISYDYEEADHPGGCLVCHCGAKKCRHNLV